MDVEIGRFEAGTVHLRDRGLGGSRWDDCPTAGDHNSRGRAVQDERIQAASQYETHSSALQPTRQLKDFARTEWKGLL